MADFYLSKRFPYLRMLFINPKAFFMNLSGKLCTLSLAALWLMMVIFSQNATAQNNDEIIQAISDHGTALSDESLRNLASTAGERRIILLGESTHGTAEYYEVRAELTKELIRNHGVRTVLVEGDWTSSWEVNKYVRNLPGAAESAKEALKPFRNRWPAWMWNNEVILDLAEWMRAFNDELPEDERAGFYGMDVYSFWDSIDEIIRITSQIDTRFADAVGEPLDCLIRFNRDHIRYVQTVAQTGEHCAAEIREMIAVIESTEHEIDPKTEFYLMMNAQVVRNGDMHYRGMIQRGAESWNERVRHFKYTLNALLEWRNDDAGAVVWAHNTHVGDARATEMSRGGMENIGQLSRVRYGEENVFAIGFGTRAGTVLAGSQWEAPMEEMEIPEPREGSFEYLAGSARQDDFILVFDNESLNNALSSVLPHRAIGVVYNPAQESGNYVQTVMPARYNAFIFIQETGVPVALD